MAIEVTMPQMGADMTEGTLVRWVKQPGDEVKRGEVIAEIETDKATVELEAFESGVLRKHVVPEGETVPVGQVIALLGAAGEAMDETPEPERKARPAVAERRIEAQAGTGGATRAPGGAAVNETATLAPQEAAAAEGTDEPPPAPPVTATGTEPRPQAAERGAPAAERDGGRMNGAPPGESVVDGRLRISPVARRIAEDAGINPSGIRGTGPDGRILRRDVEAAIRSPKAPAMTPAQPPAPRAPSPAAPVHAEAPRVEGQRVESLTRMRQAIARRMTQSKQTQPHYYLTLDVDMTAALAFRQQLNAVASEDQRVSINDLIVRACAIALERHPKFNAAYSEQGLVFHDEINIDIGIALDEGLIAPALLGCRGKSLGTIAREARDLIARAKSGHLRADEYGSGTFTITNLGNYGVEALIGIINPPQAAILGVGSVMPRPVVKDGEIAIAQLMKIALSADHRVSDGAEGARFIKEIQGLLESPVSLAL